MEIEEIILKGITESLSQEERVKVKAWLIENPKNKKTYNQLKLILASKGQNADQNGKEEVWDILNARISTSSKRMVDNQSNHQRFSWVKYAAIILISIGLGVFAQQYFIHADKPAAQAENKWIEKVSQLGQKITTKLPDGTIVKLNAGSRLLFPGKFEGDTRKVELYGEAFFEVTRNKLQPFVIQVGEMEVMVLGTSFNIKEDALSNEKTVAVKTGRVAVKDKLSGESLVLNPNQMAIQGTSNGLMKQSILSEDQAFGWTENKLVFNDNQYQTVFNEISKWFDVEFEINRKVGGEVKYTAIYENPTLEEVLVSASHIFKFQYQINGNKVIIR